MKSKKKVQYYLKWRKIQVEIISLIYDVSHGQIDFLNLKKYQANELKMEFSY